MDVCVHMRNLPPTATNVHVRAFFAGLSIPTGGVKIIGGPDGNAFIEFTSEEDLLRGKLKDGHKLQGYAVSLRLSSRTEMVKVIETAKQQLALEQAREELAQLRRQSSNSTPNIRPPSPTRRYEAQASQSSGYGNDRGRSPIPRSAPEQLMSRASHRNQTPRSLDTSRSPLRTQHINTSPHRKEHMNRSPPRNQHMNRSPPRNELVKTGPGYQHTSRSPPRTQYPNRSPPRTQTTSRSPYRNLQRNESFDPLYEKSELAKKVTSQIPLKAVAPKMRPEPEKYSNLPPIRVTVNRSDVGGQERHYVEQYGDSKERQRDISPEFRGPKGDRRVVQKKSSRSPERNRLSKDFDHPRRKTGDLKAKSPISESKLSERDKQPGLPSREYGKQPNDPKRKSGSGREYREESPYTSRWTSPQRTSSPGEKKRLDKPKSSSDKGHSQFSSSPQKSAIVQHIMKNAPSKRKTGTENLPSEIEIKKRRMKLEDKGALYLPGADPSYEGTVYKEGMDVGDIAGQLKSKELPKEKSDNRGRSRSPRENPKPHHPGDIDERSQSKGSDRKKQKGDSPSEEDVALATHMVKGGPKLLLSPYVKVLNLAHSVTTKDIREFFGLSPIASSGIALYEARNTLTLQAIIEFDSKKSARYAFDMDGMSLHGKIVVMSASSKEEFTKAKGSDVLYKKPKKARSHSRSRSRSKSASKYSKTSPSRSRSKRSRSRSFSPRSRKRSHSRSPSRGSFGHAAKFRGMRSDASLGYVRQGMGRGGFVKKDSSSGFNKYDNKTDRGFISFGNRVGIREGQEGNYFSSSMKRYDFHDDQSKYSSRDRRERRSRERDDSFRHGEKEDDRRAREKEDLDRTAERQEGKYVSDTRPPFRRLNMYGRKLSFHEFKALVNKWCRRTEEEDKTAIFVITRLRSGITANEINSWFQYVSVPRDGVCLITPRNPRSNASPFAYVLQTDKSCFTKTCSIVEKKSIPIGHCSLESFRGELKNINMYIFKQSTGSETCTPVAPKVVKKKIAGPPVEVEFLNCPLGTTTDEVLSAFKVFKPLDDKVEKVAETASRLTFLLKFDDKLRAEKAVAEVNKTKFKGSVTVQAKIKVKATPPKKLNESSNKSGDKTPEHANISGDKTPENANISFEKTPEHVGTSGDKTPETALIPAKPAGKPSAVDEIVDSDTEIGVRTNGQPVVIKTGILKNSEKSVATATSPATVKSCVYQIRAKNFPTHVNERQVKYFFVDFQQSIKADALKRVVVNGSAEYIVSFKSEDAAKQAVAKLNNVQFCGSKIVLSYVGEEVVYISSEEMTVLAENFPEKASVEEVTLFFLDSKPVSGSLLKGTAADAKGSFTVLYNSNSAAEEAIKKLSGSKFQGNVITLSVPDEGKDVEEIAGKKLSDEGDTSLEADKKGCASPGNEEGKSTDNIISERGAREDGTDSTPVKPRPDIPLYIRLINFPDGTTVKDVEEFLSSLEPVPGSVKKTISKRKGNVIFLAQFKSIAAAETAMKAKHRVDYKGKCIVVNTAWDLL